jgi:hypothetical protein
MSSYHLDHLQHLETEAIHIMREVAGEFGALLLRRQRRVGNAKRFKDFFARRRNPGFGHDLTELTVGL